jgi:DNA-binding XRE family transcriptional regulator
LGDEKEGETELLGGRRGILRGKENKLVKDLKETTITYEKLGKKYGVSRQTIFAFCKRRGIKRKPKGHETERCHMCQKLIRISKKPHSEFISIHTIVKETGEEYPKYLYHIRRLRDKGLISQRFGRLRSKRAEKAYAIYFKKRLPICTIGWKVGLKNFSADIIRHRALGWNVPPSLYDGRRGAGLRVNSDGEKSGEGDSKKSSAVKNKGE